MRREERSFFRRFDGNAAALRKFADDTNKALQEGRHDEYGEAARRLLGIEKQPQKKAAP